jgi:long-chain acyl-CoA synthetase
MSYERWQSLPEMFFEQAERHAGRGFLRWKGDGAWQSLGYREAANEVRALARGLLGLGLKPGDRVVILSESRAEWPIADLAIMATGGVTVPAYTTNTTADHQHVLTHSGAMAAIVSGKALAKRFLPAAIEAPELRFIVAIEDLELAQRPGKTVHGWAEVKAEGARTPEGLLEERIAALKRKDTACFIYTSGTGGTPKGVMLSHGAILHNCRGAHDVIRQLGLDEEVFLSFLPLSHAYEHTVGQFLPMTIGAEIWYAESAEKLMDNIAEARPTIMTAVPRLYEVIHQRILRGLAKAKPAQRRWFERALALGKQRYEKPGSLSLWQRLQDLAAELLVRRKIRKRFGGRLKALVSGGAALNYDIGLFFTALGVRILQGYGQTEAAPVISVNLPYKSKLHTVGPPMTGVELKIAEDGEILVRGEMVMLGYWRDADATAKAVVDGWLHTGDIGEIDADGYLAITDRKKDIIVLSSGDNTSPARIEGFLVLQPEIAQAMVHGDRRPHLVALLVPDADFVADWSRKNRPERGADLANDPEFLRATAAVLDRVNQRLQPFERIRRFMVTLEPFTIENAMLTPSLKIRRHKIRERYGDALAALYDR